MKKSIFSLTVVALLCLPSLGLGLPYSAGWHEDLPGASITGMEAYIKGGTFTGPLTDFREGVNGSGPALSDLTLFLASNYTGTAAVVKSVFPDAFHFYINFDKPGTSTVRIDLYLYSGDRNNVVFAESWRTYNGVNWSQSLSFPTLPTDPAAVLLYNTQVNNPQVPEPSTLFLLGAGLMGIWGARRKFRK
jgi:hypothetical protein